MSIVPCSHTTTAENLKGDDVGAPPLVVGLGCGSRGAERKYFFRLFRRSSNTWGAIPFITSRGEGLKLAIDVATDDETRAELDKPGGEGIFVPMVGEPDSIV